MKNLIIIPAYNEEEALPQTIAGLQALPDDFEILIINDGSLDGTKAVAEALIATSRLKLMVVNLPLNSGIGVAMQTGYLFAAKAGTYTYAIQFDADGQHEAESLAALVKECESRDLDLCIGSRFLDDESDGFRSTFTRRIGISFFSWLISRLSGVQVTDPTSGFRCAGPRTWRCFAERYPDDYPEPESLFWCARNRLKVGEMPVKMRARQGGVSSIRNLDTIYYMCKVSISILVDCLRAKERMKHER